jgi:hypothetical protein
MQRLASRWLKPSIFDEYYIDWNRDQRPKSRI